MSAIGKMGQLLRGSELERLAGDALTRLAIGGVRLAPFRVALALLLSGIRLRAAHEARKKPVPSRPGGLRRPRGAGQTKKGGSRHG